MRLYHMYGTSTVIAAIIRQYIFVTNWHWLAHFQNVEGMFKLSVFIIAVLLWPNELGRRNPKRLINFKEHFTILFILNDVNHNVLNSRNLIIQYFNLWGVTSNPCLPQSQSEVKLWFIAYGSKNYFWNS